MNKPRVLIIVHGGVAEYLCTRNSRNSGVRNSGVTGTPELRGQVLQELRGQVLQ